MTKDDIVLHIWNNEDIIKYCKTLDYNNWQELRSELIGQLYSMKDKKLYQAFYNGFLEYLCFTICKRIKAGHVVDTGTFYHHSSVYHISDLEIGFDVKDTSIDYTDLYQKVLQLVDDQHWYNKTLFKHYYVDGLKLREIGEMYGINIKSIHYAIGKIKNEIKKQIEDDDNDFIWN